MLVVYDVQEEKFRELDETNCDDLTLGVVFLKREALEIIKKFFIICGYALIDKKYAYFYPVDIHDDNVVIFEGTYNCMERELQELLIPFIIETKPKDGIWSSFFIDWQFYLKEDCFIANGPLIELSSECLSHSEIIRTMIITETHIYMPLNYEELSVNIIKLFDLFDVNIISSNYDAKYKYLLHSITNRYHINFKREEVIKTYYQICKICLDQMEGK